MGTLQERLDRQRAQFAKVAPPQAKAVMARATEDLRTSGILDKVISVGSPLPSFELADTAEEVLGSAELLAQGPLVLTVYRGVW